MKKKMFRTLDKVAVGMFVGFLTTIFFATLLKRVKRNEYGVKPLSEEELNADPGDCGC